MSEIDARTARRLAFYFQRNGYVRRQDPDRLEAEGAQRYKKGEEVRLTANDRAEYDDVVALLRRAGFPHGRPHAKANQTRIPIYGRAQVARFLDMVAAVSAPPAKPRRRPSTRR